MKKDALTVKELAAELRMSSKSIQRACVVVSEKRANCGTSETWGMVYLVCLVCLVGRTENPTRGTKQTR
jgi:hypothetical protein